MKVWGLLCWYEEPESWLVSTVCSLRDLCDGVIAVDGAYASFPGGLRTPRSDPAQAEAIFRAAYSSGMICNIHTPSEPWWSTDTPDEEVAKRDFMFRLGDALGEPGDWYFVIDADESIHHTPFDARQRLEKAEEEIAEVELWVRPNERFLSPRLYRGPGMRIQGHHYQWTRDGKDYGWPRRGPDAEPALTMSDLVIEHRVQHRDDYRKHQKDTYYKMRDSMLEAVGMMPMTNGGAARPVPGDDHNRIGTGGAPLTDISVTQKGA